VRTPLAAAAIIVTLGLATSACGGGGESSPTSETSLTAAQWRRQANAICRDVDREVRAYPTPKAESEIESFVAAVLPLWKREEDGLRALVAPAPVATATRDLVTALGYLNAAVLEVHIATQRRDGLRRYYAMQKLQAATRGIKLRAAALSLPACARQRIP
jgi:hypothetical protein